MPDLFEVKGAAKVRCFGREATLDGLKQPAGTLIGRDGDRPITTPYDNCMLIMPSRRLTRGQTAVRLGRIVA